MERTDAVSLKNVPARSGALMDRVAAVRRRFLPAVSVALCVLIAAFVAAAAWPPTFRAIGTILIEQQEVPVDVVRSMISSYADQRIQVITQRVMTTENLMRIIDRYNLYPEQRRNQPREALIAGMRDDIDFKMISADVVDPRLGRPTKATIAFSVSYDNRSPALAAKVANELTTLYLSENLQSRKQLASDTATFLASEADRLDGQINQLQSGFASFKEQHADALPERVSINLQLMSRTEDELRETDTRIRSLDQQIVYLDAQLAQITPAAAIYTSTGERVMSPADRLKTLKSDYARAKGVYAADHPDVIRLKREIEGMEREVGKVDSSNDLARQLSDAQSRLAQAKERYAPEHPDVAQLERLIATIEQAMRQSPEIQDSAADRNADNPAYIQVSAQRQASVNERAALEQKRTALKARMHDFEQRLAQSPDVEREYSALVRDLDNAQLKYREVRQKQMEATVSQNLETERKGERFTLIEPPFEPQTPVSPNRKVIVLLGFILAIGAGVGMIALLEVLDGTLHGKHAVTALLAVPPLAVLPWIDTPAERAARTRLRRLSMAGAASSFVVAIALVHFLYRPLDLLWQVALHRLLG